MTYILGISAYYHDSAACVVVDGEIVAAAQEERFTRLKHDPRFPKAAIEYCLREANVKLTDLDAIVFYDKPLLKFERLLETYLANAPKGFLSFARSMPIWLKEKLYLKSVLRRELRAIAANQSPEIEKPKKIALPLLLFTEHHQSHAASAFFPSPYEDAAVV
ncbi:MAG: carbamoyltransferase N-terminal domain-containing protein, partial [Alteromonas sp.]